MKHKNKYIENLREEKIDTGIAFLITIIVFVALAVAIIKY